MLHSNLDRLWAKWQTQPGHPGRMNPNTAYSGLSSTDVNKLSTEHVEPWAGGTGLEPWASNPTIRAVITYTDLSVVTPPPYDTNAYSVKSTLKAAGISLPVSIRSVAKDIGLTSPISLRRLIIVSITNTITP